LLAWQPEAVIWTRARSAMEKRSSRRFEIRLDALVHPSLGRSWRCAIQDFCAEGMLLVDMPSRHRSSAGTGLKAGELVGIHFAIPGEVKEQHFRLEGTIVRVMDTGIGIQFKGGINAVVLDSLLAHAHRQGAQAKPLSTYSVPNTQSPQPKSQASTANRPSLVFPNPADIQLRTAQVAHPQQPRMTRKADLGGLVRPVAHDEFRRLFASIRGVLTKVLPKMNSVFFSHMDEELLGLARDATSNSLQSEYFAAKSILEGAREAVGQAFIREILDQFDNPRSLAGLREERSLVKPSDHKARVDPAPLSLVDTNDFEDWLAIANIISRSERTYEKDQGAIRARLGRVVESWGRKETNPISTATFFQAFVQAIRLLDLNPAIRQLFYSGFEVKALPLFKELCLAINRILEDSKLLADADKDVTGVSSRNRRVSPAESKSRDAINAKGRDQRKGVQPRPGNTSERNGAVGQNTPSLAEEDDDTDKSSADSMRAELDAIYAELRQHREVRQTGVQASSVRRLEAAPAKPNRQTQADSGQTLGDAYSAIRTLTSQATQALMPAADGNYDAVDKLEMQQLLRRMKPPVDAESRVNIRGQLLDAFAVSGAERRLAPEVSRSLDVVEGLVDTMEQDALLSSSAKAWIRRLELTLGKVAAGEDILQDGEAPHGALQVINQLARLGGGESANMRQEVDQIIEQITINFDKDPAVFDTALSRLAPLVAGQSKAFAGNVQRIVRTSEGQQTLVSAQRAVIDELDHRLSGRRIPHVLMRLLMPGWRNLLVNTHLRQGRGSSDWQRQIQILDQLVQHLDGCADSRSDQGYMTPEVLLAQIEQGLNSIAFEPGKRAPLLKNLRELIVDRDGMAQVPNEPVGSIAEILGFGRIERREALRKQLLAKGNNERRWCRCLEQARALHMGEWLAFLDQPEDERMAIIAWTSADKSTVVLVNRRGIKTHELMVEELAKLLLDERVVILKDTDIPLSDRAAHQMLQSMHNQLTHQAAHDAVTGLPNRREFERALHRALTVAKHENVEQLVAYFDLDQFKVINNAVGHEGGDALLAQIAEVMVGTLAGKASILSRLGGDEFGVLIEKGKAGAGMDLIRTLCNRIKDFQFRWQDSVFRLTTSCGVMLVDREVDSVQSILKYADAACFAAKDAGRDRIRVYTADNSEMAHRRDGMEFVSQIDQALAEDRFVLNCQLIMPIDPNAEGRAHYEILLTVLDDNGTPMPPQGFILAAETYNRMGAIDRWVIDHAFEFIANHREKFEALGAFTINVSGNSLAEDDFTAFVLAALKRSGVPASLICFEITETSAVGSLDNVINFIQQLKVLGVQFSLDDFGTGLSSYAYLRNLPVDYLKIDGTFVKDLQSNPDDYAVVKSINEIGHFMGKRTIAEHVENDAVLAILREIGVDFVQGFGIGGKFPITELLQNA